jgi:uncharacterized protein YukE
MGFKRRYRNFVEKFLSGERGQVFFQYFYNWGASIVIIGALAKLEHWPWGLGNILLTVGLLTEFFVFFVSAFDSPAKNYLWERVFPVLKTDDEEDRPQFKGGGGNAGGNAGRGGVRPPFGETTVGSPIVVGGTVNGGTSLESSAKGGVSGGGTVIINGGGGGGSFSGGGGGSFGSSSLSGGGTPFAGFAGGGGTANGDASLGTQPNDGATVGAGFARPGTDTPNVGASVVETQSFSESIKKMTEAAEQLASMSEDMKRFSAVTDSLMDVSDGIQQSSRSYVGQMETLNRNIQGLNTIYEIQLKGVSSQIDAIERINAGLMRMKELYEGSITDSSVFRGETAKMTQQLQALNGVYSRLLEAMTVNMYGGGMQPNIHPNPYNPQNTI